MVLPQEAGSYLPSLSLRLVEEAHIGRRKREQQDSHGHLYFPAEPGLEAACLFVVADGVSMGTAGALASRTTVETLLQEFKHLYTVERLEPAAALERAFNKANLAVYELAHDRPGMATTCVAALIAGNQLITAHVGDSRAYFERVTTGLLPITTDHSWTEEIGRSLVREGEMTPEQLNKDNRRHAITRAMGLEEEITPDFNAAQLEAGDVIILCTDGLWDMLGDEKFEEILTGGTAQIRLFPPEMGQEKLEELSHRLVDEAMAAGGRDNITLALVLIDSVGLPVPMPSLSRLLQNTADDIEERINGFLAYDEDFEPTTLAPNFSMPAPTPPGLPYQPIGNLPPANVTFNPAIENIDLPPNRQVTAPPENLLAKGQQLIALGSWEEGLDELLNLERDNPGLHNLFEVLNNLLVRYFSENIAGGEKGLAKVKHLQNKLAQAKIERYNQAIFDECLQQSREASQDRNYTLANEYAKFALVLRPSDNRAKTLQELNELYLQTKQPHLTTAEKLSLAQRLYARDPDFGAIQDDLASIYMELGDDAAKEGFDEEALAWYQLIQPLRPSDTRLVSLATSKQRAIEDDRRRRGLEARPQAVAATTPPRRDPPVEPKTENEALVRLRERVSRAQKSWDSGRKEVGAEYIDLVEQLNPLLSPNPWQPTFPRVCYDYAKWLFDQKQYKEARPYFLKAQALGMPAAQQRLNEIDRAEREANNRPAPAYGGFSQNAAAEPAPAPSAPPPASTRNPSPRQPLIETTPNNLPEDAFFVGSSHAGDGVLNGQETVPAVPVASSMGTSFATPPVTNGNGNKSPFSKEAKAEKLEKPEKMVGVSGTLRTPPSPTDPLQFAASREAARLGSAGVPQSVGGGGLLPRKSGMGNTPGWLLPVLLLLVVLVGVGLVLFNLLGGVNKPITNPAANATAIPSVTVEGTSQPNATVASAGSAQIIVRMDGIKPADLSVFLAVVGEPPTAWREMTFNPNGLWSMSGVAFNKLDLKQKYAVTARPKDTATNKYRTDLPLDAPIQTLFTRPDLLINPTSGLDVSLKIEPQALYFYPLAGGDADQPLPNGGRYIGATHHNMSADFIKFYDQSGGLGRHGYPISEEFDLEGVGRVQFFERGWLVQSPNDKLVKFGSIGKDFDRLPTSCKFIPRAPASVGTAAPKVDNVFATYVKANPGIGQPISTAFEVSDGDSKKRVQYFEFGRLETNADNKPGTNLGLLGSEYARCKDWFRA